MNDFVIAECMIRQLHARYVDAVFRQDMDAFADCFTKDCEWRIAGKVVAGRAAIVRFMGEVFPLFNRILLTMRNPCVSLESPGKATARTYFTENSQMADGTPLTAVGSYYERIVDEGDQWRFAWRVFRTEYAGASDFSGPFYENLDYGAPPAMPPSDEVPPDYSGNLSGIEV